VGYKPLRRLSPSALFENLVISELMKHRFNQGLGFNLYFWRNNTGEVVDVLIEQGEHLMSAAYGQRLLVTK